MIPRAHAIARCNRRFARIPEHVRGPPDWTFAFRPERSVQFRARPKRAPANGAEFINSLLRPIQQIKKTFPSEYGYLVALHHNMRPFREGRRKGKTPFELLGLSLPTTDWIELLRGVPDDPNQPVAL